jgi:hypothetical protein
VASSPSDRTFRQASRTRQLTDAVIEHVHVEGRDLSVDLPKWKGLEKVVAAQEESQLERLWAKLGVATRSEGIAKASRSGWLD